MANRDGFIMRKLIITRGLPGSGKTSTLEALGLTDFTLSADAIRLIYSSPIMDISGRMTIPQENNHIVWRHLLDVLEKRMRNGQTVVVDATHTSENSFQPYIGLAHKYQYDIACLDFSSVPVNVSDWNNHGRPEHRIVPSKPLSRLEAELKNGRVPENIYQIQVDINRGHLNKVKEWLSAHIIDLSHYKRVMHIGDLQGTYEVLMRLLERDGGWRNDTFYIFVGDYCDRGDENGEILKWMIKKSSSVPNCAVLFGNHEYHLRDYALTGKAISTEFTTKTLPQIEASGITKQEILEFCERLYDVFPYRFNGQKVMVTHGGLPAVPEHFWQIPSIQYIKGTGYYETDVDDDFTQNTTDAWCQVHGHRNNSMLDIEASPRSFNLESSVEFGGQLSAVLFDETGWTPIQEQNYIYRNIRMREWRKSDIVPPWIFHPTTTKIPDVKLQDLKTHSGVTVRSCTLYPNVDNYSFTRRAFYDGSFDSTNVKARGLYINRKTNEIVARAYDKFFNIGERESTNIDVLAKTLKFPLTLYKKENGYLGITGYDAEKLFISSKNSDTGPFAEHFLAFLSRHLGHAGIDAFRRNLRDMEASVVFEVIDPIFDPHIVEYDTQKLVMLDVIHRTDNFECASYELLQKFAKRYDFAHKEKAVNLNNAAALLGWYAHNMKDKNNKIEGYVIKDASGFQCKFKTPWYSFWKLCRGMKDAMIRERENNKKSVQGMSLDFLRSRQLDMFFEDGQNFFEFCKSLSTNELKYDIISLRNLFQAQEIRLKNEMDPRI